MKLKKNRVKIFERQCSRIQRKWQSKIAISVSKCLECLMALPAVATRNTCRAHSRSTGGGNKVLGEDSMPSKPALASAKFSPITVCKTAAEKKRQRYDEGQKAKRRTIGSGTALFRLLASIPFDHQRVVMSNIYGYLIQHIYIICYFSLANILFCYRTG